MGYFDSDDETESTSPIVPPAYVTERSEDTDQSMIEPPSRTFNDLTVDPRRDSAPRLRVGVAIAIVVLLLAAISSLAYVLSLTPADADASSDRENQEGYEIPFDDEDDEDDEDEDVTTTRAEAQAAQKKLEDDVEALHYLLNVYWQDKFANDPAFDDGYWEPVRSVNGYESSDIVSCGRDRGRMPRNAFYCSDGRVEYDENWFLDNAIDDPGNAATYFILAHEWGHAVQYSMEADFDVPRNAELQADCFAGAFLSDGFEDGTLIEDENDYEVVMDQIDALGDPAEVDWLDPHAHGTPNQRRMAYMIGFQGDADDCVSAYK